MPATRNEEKRGEHWEPKGRKGPSDPHASKQRQADRKRR
jgi:hypothetical protein